MRKIYIPSKVTSSIKGYEELLGMHNELQDVINEVIQFSFLKVVWFEANLVAILGSIIEDLEWKGNIIKIIDIDDYTKINNVFFRNGFFSHHGLIHNNTKGGDTQIPYKMFMESEPELFNSYIQSELLENSDFPKHSNKLGAEIKRNIFELFENARTHGKCSHIHTCGQFYPTKRKLNITIVDTGRTIVSNVQDYLKKDLDSCSCIDWAMAMNNTTKAGNTPGGLGLGLIFEFIELNEGKIQVISSDGYWELKEGEKRKSNLNFYFSGTIVNLEFNLKDNKLYKFASEVVDLKNIF
ncbi:ATP-binding protein [Polaribacter atrinae]|uniref:ATP-binding protein n=1 Tax=Polaribacter atrinae TaxID=1333662 RepID=UPI00248F48B8|nr:hypothetical protein [Polaribacter atrinae]